ncbi:MAG TPA: DUF2147 domain-containing protein [Saprospiraceae bacterium]|nr:DUF2147 domain-containing protein [Saprospiraceae bacterium]
MDRIILLSLMMLGFLPVNAQETILGSWTSIDDQSGEERSHIRIYRNSQGEIEGRVTEVLSSPVPIDETVCQKCSRDDPRYKQPVEGMVVITDMKASPDKKSARGGQILDPESGREYGCILTLTENGQKLKVRGFVGFKALGRTQVWRRNN